jgi:hypothetical protein
MEKPTQKILMDAPIMTCFYEILPGLIGITVFYSLPPIAAMDDQRTSTYCSTFRTNFTLPYSGESDST